MNRRNFFKSIALFAAGSAWAQNFKDLYQPTRYAFVADKFTNFITVIDIHTGEKIKVLNFGIRPHIIEMARDDACLAVASPEVYGIYFYDLRLQTSRFLSLPAPVYQIFFIPQSKWIAVGLRDQVGLINYQTLETKIFSKRFDSAKRDTNLNTYYSLLFSSFSNSFWVLDEENPQIFYRQGNSEQDWQTLDFSQQIEGGLGTGVASAEDYVLAFTNDSGLRGYLYFPQDKRLLDTGEMYRGNTNEALLDPYIDIYTRHVIFADKAGHVAVFNLQKPEIEMKRFEVPFSPRFIRTGWRESLFIIGGDRGLLIQDFANPENKRFYEFPYEIMDMWVTGDSKTLLYTIDELAPQLFRVDLRTKEHLQPLRLYNVVMGEKIRMGSNNSICY